jgi:hypothetical protein
MCARETAVYNRITSHYSGSLQFHGTLAERLLIHEDLGAIRLQFFSGRFGEFEYVGKLARDNKDALRLCPPASK